MRRTPVILVLIAAVLALFARAGTAGSSVATAETTIVPAEFTGDLIMYCLPDNTVSVVLKWTSNDAGPQWIDLSLFDNQFAPGTFLGTGPLPAGQESVVWNGLLPATWHFARVNTLTSGGWVASKTMFFYTRDDCPSVVGFRALPPPPACLDSLAPDGLAACVWTTRPDLASFLAGEAVVYCYAVNQPMNVTIIVRKPDGTALVVIDRFDLGTGACIGPYQAAKPLGLRVVDLYGGPDHELLSETRFFVQ